MDDMRSGALKYTIINDAFLNRLFKSSSYDQNQHDLLLNLAYIRLSKTNEIICVDSFTEFKFKNDNNNASYMCWRYSKPRALAQLRILPLPFMSILETDTTISDKISSPISKNTQHPGYKEVKAYLEYLNECTKKFVIFREFTIREGDETRIIEKDALLEQSNNKLSFMKHYVYSKVWRIRLSVEAKKVLYASSLLASAIVDSFEINQSDMSSKNLQNLHLQLSISNLELKLNSVNLNINDLVLVNMSEFSSMILLNRFEMFSCLTLNSYAQLSMDYCEYKFLTLRPMIDPFQFKINSKVILDSLDNFKIVDINFDIDTISLLISQSGLIALKQLESEFKLKTIDKTVSIW
jgi:hypothetical protein